MSSKCIRHDPCEKCGSKDNKGVYDDGHTFCFGCRHWTAGDGDEGFTAEVGSRGFAGNDLPRGFQTAPLLDRRISHDTMRKYGVTVEFNRSGDIVTHYYPYYSGATYVASKVRRVEDKGFFAIGDLGDSGLFGEQVFSSRRGGKFITITEGELDALAVYEMFGGKGAAVSLKSGASGAVKDIKNSLEFLETFDKVVICFDDDKPGQEAAKKVAGLFSPKKCKIMKFPEGFKDACDMLKANKVRDFTNAWWDAKVFTPEGIVRGSESRELFKQKDERSSVPWPWDGLNEKLKGLRAQELVTLTAGSGLGKSSILREAAWWLKQSTNDNVGVMMMEESVQRAQRGIAGIGANKPLADPDVFDLLPDEEVDRIFDQTFASDQFFFLDHFGSYEEDGLLAKLRYFAKGLDCKWIIFDHISIAISGLEGDNERQLIDRLMTKLRSFVQETGVGMLLVSHLKRPNGDKGHEQGSVTSLSQLRGSHAIAQLSDIVIGLERDSQNEDDNVRNTTNVRVLKDRMRGRTGLACSLRYDEKTGRLHELMDIDDTITDRDF